MTTIFQALLVSHQTQRDLCAQLLASKQGTSECLALFAELKSELQAHATAEERCFYVPLFEHDEAVDLSRHAIAEHHEMDEMVESLEEAEPNSAEWMEWARKLCHKVEHHLGEEEGKFFAQAGEVLGEEQKVELAAAYEAEFASMRSKQEA